MYNGNIATIVWQGKKPIYFITSAYIASCLETVKRYDDKEKKKVDVVCPNAVKAYNMFMGGTDKNDQMTKL